MRYKTVRAMPVGRISNTAKKVNQPPARFTSATLSKKFMHVRRGGSVMGLVVVPVNSLPRIQPRFARGLAAEESQEGNPWLAFRPFA